MYAQGALLAVSSSKGDVPFVSCNEVIEGFVRARTRRDSCRVFFPPRKLNEIPKRAIGYGVHVSDLKTSNDVIRLHYPAGRGFKNVVYNKLHRISEMIWLSILTLGVNSRPIVNYKSVVVRPGDVLLTHESCTFLAFCDSQANNVLVLQLLRHSIFLSFSSGPREQCQPSWLSTTLQAQVGTMSLTYC